MATKATLGLALFFLNPLFSAAHSDPLHLKRSHHEHALHVRQSAIVASASGSSYLSASATAAPAPAAASSGSSSPPSTLTATNPNIPPLSAIVSGMPSQATPAFTFTFTPGASPPVSGAPPLPTTTLDRSKYPSPTQLAPIDTPEVAQWLTELDGIQIPDIPQTTDGALCSSNAAAAADSTRCWWTCGGCTRNTDVFTCPNKMDWGVSFDDGPSPYTPMLLDYLNQQNLDATFFVIGASAYWLPQVVQAEYMRGHQIAVHTWHHQYLTTLSNVEIVAELGYTREIIKDIIGVTPSYFRPPYGDIDDRVRAIAMAMGLIPILWTRDPHSGAQFDTNDWQIPGGESSGSASYAKFQSILANASTDLNTGFIVLEHDLFQQTVDLATGYTLPAAQSHQPSFNLKSINQCLGQQLSDVYQETASNKTRGKVSTNWAGPFLDGLSNSGNSSVNGSSSNSGNSGTGTGTGSGGKSNGSRASRAEQSAGVLVVGALVLLGTLFVC